jgi:hypothetical protein
MYDREIGFSSFKTNSTGVLANGALIKIDDTYCDDTLASSSMRPPFNPPPEMCRGGQPVPSFWYSIPHPCSRSAVTRALIGRSCIRWSPVMVTLWSDGKRVSAVVRKRLAVPAFAR